MKPILIALVLALSPLSAQASIFSYFGEKAANLLKETLKDKGIDLTWKTFEPKKEKQGLLDHRWTFTANDVCVKTQSALKKACFPSMSATIRYGFSGALPKITELGPIELLNGTVEIDPSANTGKKEDSNSEPLNSIPIPEISLPGLLSGAAFFPLRIEIDTIQIEQERATPITGTIKIKMDPKGSKPGPILLNLTLDGLPEQASLRATATIESATDFKEDDYRIQLDARYTKVGGAGGTAIFKAKKQNGEDELEADLQATWEQKELKAEANIHALAKPSQIEVTLNAKGKANDDTKPSVEVKDCHLTLVQRHLQLHCPAQLHNLTNRTTLKTVSAVLKGTVNHPSLIPSPSEVWQGQIGVFVDPIRKPWLDMGAEFDTQFEGVIVNWKDLNASADVDFNLNIKKFSELQAILASTPLAIPAPLDVLDGTTAVSITGNVSTENGGGSLPIHAEMDLSSTEQAVQWTSEGKLDIKTERMDIKAIHATALTEIQSIRLRLPNLDPASSPQFGLDPRILKEKVKKKSTETEKVEKLSQTPTITYDIQIKSQSDDAIQLINERTKKPLPISINVKAKSDQPLAGSIQVNETALKMFRRDAHLNHFKVDLRDPAGSSVLDGQVSVKYADYTVLIRITGTADRPRILMESDPPLPEEDILSVLIYGEPMAGLDSSESGSVGAMSAAIADRAMALASLYLFASTPIQRVGYNPETGKVSARIKLGEGTSLVVGGSEREQEAGIRRRLGKGWYLTTLIHPPGEESQSTKASAFLEWLKRF